MTWWQIVLIVIGAWTVLSLPLGWRIGRRLRRASRATTRRPGNRADSRSGALRRAG